MFDNKKPHLETENDSISPLVIVHLKKDNSSFSI